MDIDVNYEVYLINTIYYNFSNYSYIIVNKTTKASLIVDPAWDFKKITDKIYQLGAYLTSIVLTHSHIDHVNLVNPLIKQFNPRVYMSELEINYYGFRCRNLYALNDMDRIDIGETKVLCLLTPGHTAGGMCYLLQDSLFSGDTIFSEGCGVCNFKGGSAEQMFESIQRIKFIVPSDIRIYPGHSYGKMPGQTLEYIMKENVYFQINKKSFFIDFRMRENKKSTFDFKK
ncbi:MBL fold metallo-hydrolase [Desulfosporosinus nitroreducens]|uniref:MBL fold metallo-hydrolase n=1 Tax=Desulfosporosinus nitroreducens TaxID=2018668 RepID=UPI00207C9833|nr:MBL fold metallo-hydrolase [Desulfosporosinus nitroreducens]MCO1604479.1 MBL fold metallo-hydrolase [Desulfosporosinus nitroreducens]